ncbi:hypothetical protein [Vibrio sp. M260112]
MEIPSWLIYFFLICLAATAGLFVWSVGIIYQLFMEVESNRDEY